MNLGHSKTLRIGDFLQKNFRPPLLPFKSLRRMADILFDNIVPQDNADLSIIGEIFGRLESVGDSAFPFLISIIDVLEAKFLAIPEEPQKITGVVPPLTLNMSRIPGIPQVDRFAFAGKSQSKNPLPEGIDKTKTPNLGAASVNRQIFPLRGLQDKIGFDPSVSWPSALD